jgi:hypothetical protein
MEKDLRYYPIKQRKNNVEIEEKYIMGEIYKEHFGIQPTKTLRRDLCFQITHIPSGHLLTQLYFSKIIDAKRYIDWFTKDVKLGIFAESDPGQLHIALIKHKKVEKQKLLEKKYGDKAIVFEA